MNRRKALQLTLATAVGCGADALAAPGNSIPIIDTHIHLFDINRPGGVPWPEKTDTAIYQPSLPDRFARTARPFGIVGAIAVEASPLERDNDWVLDQAADHPIIVGFVGDLIPGSASFARDLDRLRRNPIFLGIRYGNLWHRNLGADMKIPGFLADLRRLAVYGLELDTANPDPDLIRAILNLSDRISDLRIILDHLPNATLPEDSAIRGQYWADLKRLSQNPRVFMKLSEVPVRVGDRVPADVSFYREKLDVFWDIFGEDRILYASDFPNSDHVASYGTTFGIVRDYVAGKGQSAEEKFFWKNSVAAYRWRRREPDQPNPDSA